MREADRRRSFLASLPLRKKKKLKSWRLSLIYLLTFACLQSCQLKDDLRKFVLRVATARTVLSLWAMLRTELLSNRTLFQLQSSVVLHTSRYSFGECGDRVIRSPITTAKEPAAHRDNQPKSWKTEKLKPKSWTTNQSGQNCDGKIEIPKSFAGLAKVYWSLIFASVGSGKFYSKGFLLIFSLWLPQI